MNNQSVLLEVNQQVATIILNRPDLMNAMDMCLISGLRDVVNQIQSNHTIRAVIIKGNGPCFCAGADLNSLADIATEVSSNPSKEVLQKQVDEKLILLESAIYAIRELPYPTLAVCHGSVAGAGITLMLAADLVIAAEDTKFTLAYSKLGLSPDGGSTYFLPRSVGSKKALELYYLSEVFSAEQAKQYGIINWVVTLEDLTSQSEQIINKLANAPTKALAATKEMVYQSLSNTVDQQFAMERKYFAHSMLTDDFKTGVFSFLKKEKPKFQGK